MRFLSIGCVHFSRSDGQVGPLCFSTLHVLLELQVEDDILAVERAVYSLLDGEMSSISVEHGVGTLKKEFLSISRTKGEIDLMRALKQLMDTDNILSRGRIFDQAQPLSDLGSNAPT